jgi:hypothetical protein
MADLKQVVESLTRAKMGKEVNAERMNTLLQLETYLASQNKRAYLLIWVLVLLLLLPLIITQLKSSEVLLPYLLGGSGLLSAGTAKLVIDAFRDVNRAQTLLLVCKNLSSADSKEVLTSWLKG